MNEERDVATATRSVLDGDTLKLPITPPVRIEQQRVQLPEMRTVQGVEFTRDQIELLKRTIAKDASDDELDLFLYQCKRTRLDPFTRQCYFMKRSAYDKRLRKSVDKFSFETSIDGLRLIAERTDKYAGQIAPEWADVQPTDHGIVITWYPVWPFRDREPYAARVGVLRKDFDQPLFAVARFDAYMQTVDVWENDQRTDKKRLNAMWEKRGAEQLAKCAEALALRQAFPNEMSGVYTSEEMGQSENDRDDDDVLDERKQQPTREPRRETKRSGMKQERSAPVTVVNVLAIYAGRTVSRYASKFPFGVAPIKGAALDQNELTTDGKSVIEREYIVSGDLLARAWDWCDKALSGKQTVDEIIDGKKTGKKLPVVLDDAGRKRMETLKRDVEQEVERRQIERDEAHRRVESAAPQSAAPVQDPTAADDAREQLAEEAGEDRGEAYEGD
jgi:phage recombination protein Bet